MNRSFTLLALLMLLVTLPSFAQKNKENEEEEKYWKRKVKEYSKAPLTLRDEIDSYQKEIAALKKEREEMKTKLAAADKTTAQLSNEMTTLKTNAEAEIANLQTKLNAKTADYKELESKCSAASALTEALTGGGNVKRQPVGKDGISFRVQIGAFAQDTVAFASTDSYVLEVQQEADLSKYVLASFAEYQDAAQLKDKLRRLGIRGAFVVAYISGKRVPVEEAISARSGVRQAQDAPMPAATTPKSKGKIKVNTPAETTKPKEETSESTGGELDEFN